MQAIKIIFFSLTISILTIDLAQASIDKYSSPHKDGYIQEVCNKSKTSCDITMVNQEGRTTPLISEIEQPLEVLWINNDIAKITINCGSPCTASIFANIHTSKTEIIDMLLTSLDDKNIIAYPDKNSIAIKKLFTDRQLNIHKEFSPVAALSSAITDIHFIDANTLNLSYLQGDNFSEVTEVIKFDLESN